MTALIDQFLSRVNPGPERDSCWLWTGSTIKGGYGVLYPGGKTEVASRISYSLFRGPIPDGLFVLHSCDNPPCVNPLHLNLGTQKENARQREERNRGNHPKGSAHGRAIVTESQVKKIRKRAGQTNVSLGAEFGVSPSTISLIRHRKRWSHV